MTTTHLLSRNHNEHFLLSFKGNLSLFPLLSLVQNSSIGLVLEVTQPLSCGDSLLVYRLLPTCLVPLVTTFSGAVLNCHGSSNKRSSQITASLLILNSDIIEKPDIIEIKCF